MSAKKVAEKVLAKAGIDLKNLKQQLEAHLGRQPKVSGDLGATKHLGQNMMPVLEKARSTMSILGVSCCKLVDADIVIVIIFGVIRRLFGVCHRHLVCGFRFIEYTN